MAERILAYKIVVTGTEAQVKELGRHEIAIKKLAGDTRLLEKRALELANQNKQGGIEFKGLTKKIGENRAKIIDLRNVKNSLAKTISNESKLNRTNANTIGQVNAQLAIEKRRINDVVVGSKRFKVIADRIRNLERRQREFNAQLGRARTFTSQFSKSAVDAFTKAGLAIGGVLIALRTLQRLTGGIINIFKDFQQANAELAAVLGKSRSEITELIDDSKRLGATTAFTASEVAKLQKEFAKLGFSTREILDATEATLDLAAATGTELAEAAKIAGATVRGFGLDASETIRVTDVMAKSFSSSALDMEKFQVAMSKIAPVAKAVGLTIEETTGFMGVLSDSGIEASTVGTSLRKIFIELSKQGLTLNEALDQINNSQDKLNTAQEIFGIRAATSALVLADNADKAAELTIKLNEAGGAAKRMAEEQLDTLTGSTIKLSSAWEGFILNLEDGEGAIATAIRSLTDMATSFLKTVVAVDETQAILKKIKETGFAETMKEISDRVKEGETNTRGLKEAQFILRQQLIDTFGEVTGIEKFNEFITLAKTNAQKLIIAQRELTKAQEENKNVVTELTTEEAEEAEKAAKKKEKAEEKLKIIRDKFIEERRLALLTEEQRELDALKKRVDELRKAGVEENKINEFIKDENKKINDKFREKDRDALLKEIQDRVKAEQDGMALRLFILTQEFNEGKITEEKFKEEKLRIRKDTLEGIKEILEAEVNEMTASLEAVNIEESLLSDEQKEALLLKIEEVKAKISELTKPDEDEELEEGVSALSKLLGLDDEGLEVIFAGINAIKNVIGEIGNLQNTITNEKIKANDKETKSLTKNIDEQIAKAKEQGRNTDALEKQKQSIIDASDAKNKILAERGFERNKRIQKGIAVISGAQAIMSILSARPLADPVSDAIIKAILIAAAAVTTGIQISNISKTTLKKGGILKGKSHEEGGIAFTVDGQSGFEAEGGEGIINKHSMSSKDIISLTGTPGEIASDINSYKGYGAAFGKGGQIPIRRFQVGAILPIPNITKIQQQAVFQDVFTREEAVELIQEGIATITVQQVESEVTETQKTVETIESGVEF